MNIVVTGIGAVTAAGIGVDKLWSAASEGISCISNIEYEWSVEHNPISIFHVGKVRDFNFTDHFQKSERLLLDPFTSYALLATREAISNSGLTAEELSGPRTAVVFGTGMGGATTFDSTSYSSYYLKEKKLNPFTVPKIMPSAAASHISIKHNINGPNFTIASACAASTQSIGIGMSLIRSGLVDRAIVGGSEALLSFGVMKTWEVLRALSPTSIKPFSKDRDGTVIGEGAGIIILEREDINKARGGNYIAKIIGFGNSSDGKDIVKPDLEGSSSAIRYALDDAKLAPEMISYINTHGSGTPLNDKNETAAIKKIFGNHAYNLSISSTKPITGHVLGGTGVIESIVTLKAMQESFIPPTINYNEPDPECDLDVVPNIGKPAVIDYAMKTSFGFGGINAVLIFSK